MLLSLAALVPCLLVLGAAAVAAPRPALALAALAGAAAGVLALAALLLGTGEALSVPLGPWPGGARLALDGLSAWFILILGVVATAACAQAAAVPPRAAAALPPFVGLMLLCLLAQDPLTLLIGFEGMAVAAWWTVASDRASATADRAARLFLLYSAGGALALAAALGLQSAAPGAAFLLLALAAAAAKGGLVPLHLWLPLAHPAAPAPASALMSAAMTKVALYVLARLLLDAAGPATPAWWGLPLVALGVASAVLGALRATQESDIKALLACSTVDNVGLIAVGLGLALVFRGADLPALAALALGAALLHALAHALAKTALFLAAGHVQHSARSRRLEQLGGLLGRMPGAGAVVLVAAASLAALPPTLGFAADWALLQALIAAPRLGLLGMQIALVVTLALVALAVALGAVAMLRLVGIAFLGRARSPAAAGAEEADGATRAVLAGLGGALLLLGVLPGLAAPLLSGTVAELTGAAWPSTGWLAMGAGSTAYAPLPVVVLLAVPAAAALIVLRRMAAPPPRMAPAWDCGFGPPPLHLPLGDPATQASAAALAQPLRRMFGHVLLLARERVSPASPGSLAAARLVERQSDPLAALPRWTHRATDRLSHALEWLNGLTIRRALALMLATLVAVLALVAALEAR